MEILTIAAAVAAVVSAFTAVFTLFLAEVRNQRYKCKLRQIAKCAIVAISAYTIYQQINR